MAGLGHRIQAFNPRTELIIVSKLYAAILLVIGQVDSECRRNPRTGGGQVMRRVMDPFL